MLMLVAAFMFLCWVVMLPDGLKFIGWILVFMSLGAWITDPDRKR